MSIQDQPMDDYWAEADRRSHERGEHVNIPGLMCHVCIKELAEALVADALKASKGREGTR